MKYGRGTNPIVNCLAELVRSNASIDISNMLPNGVILTFRGRKWVNNDVNMSKFARNAQEACK